MADATTFEDVPMPAEQVWDVIGDFGNIRKWATVVQDQTLEETPSGKVRSLTMADGTVVKEALVVASQYSYTYTILDRPSLKDFRSTIAVVPLDESNCRIELVVHVASSEDATDEDLTAGYARFVRGNLKAMKRAAGLG